MPALSVFALVAAIILFGIAAYLSTNTEQKLVALGLMALALAMVL